ncbi:MAG TPA: low specificity L-threonine aldolase [Candidatus Babeliales bacterium]|nr:low specificity L-threonine aldolase [Candidatus Babeliales bacterium]
MLWKSFASDNYAGIHPTVLKAINDANRGHEKAYADDNYTEKAIGLFKKHFGNDIDVYFLTTGTAANVLCLSALVKPYESIICAESAHINVDECGAPEHYIGSKLLAIPTQDGKLTVAAIQNQLLSRGDQHRVQPRVISITQGTECGTLYTPAEIAKITEFAHAHDMYVHMDGARLSNAAASLNVSLAVLTKDVGIDVVCFGGTKNGMMIGEAAIFFNKELSKDFKYIRKQGMQLVSKMRFISAQFIALLTDDLWLKNAQHANAMAMLLADEIKDISYIKISKQVQANAVFAILDQKMIALLQEKYSFYVWDSALSEVRWMTSWDTTREDVMEFVAFIKKMKI